MADLAFTGGPQAYPDGPEAYGPASLGSWQVGTHPVSRRSAKWDVMASPPHSAEYEVRGRHPSRMGAERQAEDIRKLYTGLYGANP
jgi:hypothetical protein